MLAPNAPITLEGIFTEYSGTAVDTMAAEAAKAELERQLSVIKDVAENHQAFVRILNEVTRSFLECGVGRMPTAGWYWCGFREGTRWDWQAYINKLAKEAKRPYVFSVNASLTIEKKAYTRALYSHLLLIAADEGVGRYDWQAKLAAREKDVSFSQNGSRLTFNFHTEKGMAILRHWLDQTKSDPEFRKALRLPEAVTC